MRQPASITYGIVGAPALTTRGGGLKRSFTTSELYPLTHAILMVILPKDNTQQTPDIYRDNVTKAQKTPKSAFN